MSGRNNNNENSNRNTGPRRVISIEIGNNRIEIETNNNEESILYYND